MRYSPTDAANILSRTPDVLEALLLGLPEPWPSNNYGPETFSPKNVVGHLIAGERADWIERSEQILSGNGDTPFRPFDHRNTGGFDDASPIDDMLATFRELRERNLETMRGWNLTDEQLDLPGTHPALGPVTLRELLATWVTHDLHHLAQICKGLARQYAEEVGPWRAYVGILNR